MRDTRDLLVWEEALRFVRERNLDGYAEMFTPDGVVELPFPLPGMPRRMQRRQRNETRDEIRRVLAPVWRAQKDGERRIERVDARAVHEADDPGLVVIVFDVHGVEASGTPYRLAYVHVVTVRDGRIAVLSDDVDARAIRERMRSAADERSRDLVRRYFEMWNTNDFDRIDRVLAEGYVDHAHPELAGPAEVAAAARQFHASNPGASVTIDTLVAEGDLVAARTTIRRTRRGEAIVTSGMAFFRVQDDRLAEQWSCYPGA
jgi:ketosteroid isomerase-like protein